MGFFHRFFPSFVWILLISLGGAISLPPPTLAALRVTIDPGHGGLERGAVHGGVTEAQVALEISKRLYARLKKDKQFSVQLLRRSDVDISLEKRVDRSEAFKTDLFLSIHANANPSPKVGGMELYIQNQMEPEEESKFLAHIEQHHSHSQQNPPKGDVEAILFDLKKSHKILKSYQVSHFLKDRWPHKKRRMIRQGPFFVLSHSETPAVLVEVGYLSNPKERKRLIQADYQNQIVRKIHLALKDYGKNMDKLPSIVLEPGDAKTP